MADRREYKREFVKNYRYVRTHFRKGVESDEELYQYLESKENVSEYMKELIKEEMDRQKALDKMLQKIGCHPLEDLIQSEDRKEFRNCYDVDDVIEKLDQMNTSRETHFFDKDGNDCQYYDGIEFLKHVARPDMDGMAEWFGWNYCGPDLKAIVKITGYDWDDEEMTFTGMTEEIIGYDY